MSNYLRGAACIGLGTTIKYLRGAAGIKQNSCPAFVSWALAQWLAQLLPRVLVHEVFYRGAQVVSRGGVRCASQVLDRGAQADAHGTAQVIDRGAQVIACGAAR